MEFTGERYVPEVHGNIEIEHIHRYLQACEIAKGKIVLDIASGEGYGSAMLAGKAQKVTGVDISIGAVNHARKRYKMENLDFMVGSCADIPLPDASIDLVVSFETIEHLAEHAKMMQEIKRVLRSDGVLLISSPDKYNYSVEPGYSNPYHVKELYIHEFKQILGNYFKNAAYFGQRIVYGSNIFSELLPTPALSYVEEDGHIITTPGVARPIYSIALASDGQLPAIASSVLEQHINDSEIVRSWSALIAEKEQLVQALSGTLHEITISKAWRLAMLLRRMRVLFLPPGSWGARLLKNLMAVLLLPLTIWKSFRIRKDTALLYSSGLFDETWYLENNPDVASAGENPARHYLLFGGFEGRDPSPYFNTQRYRNDYPDIAKSRINPLIHYLKFGMAEGRVLSYGTVKGRLDIPYFGTEDIKDQVEMTLPIRKLAQFSHPFTRVSIVIPTKNAGPFFREVLDAIKKQQYEGPVELIIIDSGSIDNTLSLASEYGAIVVSISPQEFDHGLTRNRAIQEASGEIIILMSQDALPGNEYLIHNFVIAFEDPHVAGAYARQIPREDADVITERNLNNWLTGRKNEEVRWIENWETYQNLSPMEHFYFCNFEDVCSAIRKNVWKAIPYKANEFGEDIEWAQEALEAGWKIAYWPTAYVIHSHQRSYRYEYDRTHLCHKKLYRQFGIHTVPSRKHMLLSTLTSISQDWRYALQHEKRPGALLNLLAKIPALSFASVYGQYSGARAGIERSQKLTKKLAGKKLRIVLTTHQFVPDYSSGTEILTFETAKELKKLGHEVSVITGFPVKDHMKDAERFDQYSIEGINVVRFRHSYVPMGDQSNAVEMEYNNRLFGTFFKNYLRYEKPDVVHFFHLMRLSASAVDACHELDIPSVFTPTDFWFICPTCQLRLPNNQNCYGPDKSGVNCLRHVVSNNQSDRINAQVRKLPDWVLAVLLFFIKHGINIDTRYSPMVRAFSKRREFLVQRINLIDKVVTPTQIMRSMLTKNGLEDQRTISIPFGLNLAHLQNTERPKSSNVLRLGYIGTLYEHKGVHILVEAMQKLASKPIELKIYGKPDDFPEYVEDLRKNSQEDPRIKFCGTFPNHEIGKVFSELDALVVPSLWFENSPLVIYSAQAARCPVIASNMEGISEVIEHGKNGLLFEAGNVSELATTIEALLDDNGLLQKLSDNARKPLSILEYALKLLEIYRDLITKDRSL